jgi:hypothetical protein
VIDPKKTFLAQQMLGYDAEKIKKELDAEGNTLSKKLVVSSPIIPSVVTEKKGLLSAIVLLVEDSLSSTVREGERREAKGEEGGRRG